MALRIIRTRLRLHVRLCQLLGRPSSPMQRLQRLVVGLQLRKQRLIARRQLPDLLLCLRVIETKIILLVHRLQHQLLLRIKRHQKDPTDLLDIIHRDQLQLLLHILRQIPILRIQIILLMIGIRRTQHHIFSHHRTSLF